MQWVVPHLFLGISCYSPRFFPPIPVSLLSLLGFYTHATINDRVPGVQRSGDAVHKNRAY